MEYRFGTMHSTDMNMQRHRVGARGNVTCFPLPWEHLLEQFQDVDAKRTQVPRTGEELADLVRVLLKTSTSDDEETKALLRSCIHQARVRRAVVVKLILDAKARGHPAYKHVDEDTVKKRSLSLPEDDIPEKLFGCLLRSDNSIEKLKPQKAATPFEARVQPEAAFRDIRPHAVVQERSSADFSDLNEQHLSSLYHTASLLPAASSSKLHEPSQGDKDCKRDVVATWSPQDVAKWAHKQLSP